MASSDLTARELSLLRYLLDRPRQDVSREELLTEVLGFAPGVRSRAVDAAMKRVRRKLGEAGEALRTVHGVGYRYDPPAGDVLPEGPVPAPAGQRLGDAVLDLERRTVARGATEHALTPRESAILAVLLDASGAVVTRERLARAWDGGPGRRAVAAAIRRLRAKLEEDPARPRHLLAVRGTGWRLEVEPATSGRTNVVPAGTRFCGRGRERAAAASALARPGQRLVLVGPGGAGKTRLARELALDLAGRGLDAWWVEARDAATVDELAVAVGEVLGAGADARGVGRVLAGRGDLLLVLDNLEQVPGAGAQVAAWAEGAPEVRWLLTSRHVLDDAGEHLALAPLPEEDAAALFLDRARARHPRFEVAGDVLRDLVRGLDGLPLAIELAAARAGHLDPRRLADHLAERPLAVAGGALRSALAWSWSLLAPHEQAALAQLSWLRDPFDADEGEAVARLAPDAPWLPDVLQALVQRSLLLHDPDTSRYRWLEHVRVFAAGQAGASEARDRWTTLVLASQRRQDLLALLDTHPDPAVGVAAALRLDPILYLRGAWSTRLGVLERAAALARPAVPEVLVALADARRRDGQLSEARADLEEALAAGAGPEAHRGLCKLLRDLGDLEGAEAQGRLALAGHQGDPVGEAAALAELAACALATEAGEAVLPPVREALRANRAVGQRRTVGLCLAYLGLALTGLHRHAEAAEAFTEALRILEEVASGPARGGILADLARLRLERGRLEGAEPLLRFAVAWFERHGDPWLAGQCQLHLGLVAHLRGDAAAARAAYVAAAARLEEAGVPAARLLAEAHVAAAEADLGDADRAGARLAALVPSDALGRAVVELCRAHVDRARGAADALSERLLTADAVADPLARRHPVLQLARLRWC